MSLFVTFEEMTDHEMVESGVHDRIPALLREFEGPEQTFMSGVPRIKVEAAELIRDDTFLLGPISFLVVSLVLLAAFRSWRGTIVPALTTGAGTIWTIGLMGFLDVPITIITGTMDARWNNDVLNPAFHSLRASDFEVVELGWRGGTSTPPTAPTNLRIVR